MRLAREQDARKKKAIRDKELASLAALKAEKEKLQRETAQIEQESKERAKRA